MNRVGLVKRIAGVVAALSMTVTAGNASAAGLSATKCVSNAAARVKNDPNIAWVRITRTVRGDINGDGRSDIGAVYAYGTTGTAHGLGFTVCLNKPTGFKIAGTVHDFPFASVTKLVFKQRTSFSISGYVYGPSDANCCPSIPKEAIGMIGNGKLMVVDPLPPE